MALQEEYYAQLYEQYQRVSTVRHDASELLQFVKGMDDIVLLDDLERTLDRSFAVTGVKELDVALYFTLRDAKRKSVEIEMESQISGDLSWVEPVHFFILLHNAVQNAIDAVSLLSKEGIAQPESVHIKMIGSTNRFSLQVKNPTHDQYEKTSGSPIQERKNNWGGVSE